MRLYKRTGTFQWGVNGVLDTEITGLRFQFKIEKNLEKSANTGEVKVFNLNETSRSKLEQEGALCAFKAGYGGDEKLILAGNISRVFSEKQGVDWITTVEVGDGEKALNEANIELSFSEGASSTDIISKVTDAIKNVKNGGVESVKNLATNLVKQFTKGFTASGSATEILTELGKTMGFDYSVQDGELQILPTETATFQESTLLSPDSGLIGSPTALKAEQPNENTRKGITVKSLLQPDIKPGRLLRVENASIEGTFRAEKVTHEGDTREGAFFTTCEAFEV